jgi:hypothetical protein
MCTGPLPSLVDVRSTEEHIIDHWHRLVDCRGAELLPVWAAVRPLELPYGWVTFSTLGVVKSLERERAREVGERALFRLEERGESVRGDRHREQEVRDRAEERCRETCSFRLKLCFEAFLQAEDGTVVQVAPPIFSDNILDETRPDKTGDLPVQKISACSDTVEGGQEVMVFTGNDTTRVSLRRSNFYVEFFQLDGSGGQQAKLWQSGRLQVPACDLHGLGQVLGGLTFKVPVFDRDQPGSGRPAAIDSPTENVFFEVIKTNKAGKEEAKSDPIFFTYRPSRHQVMGRKRSQDFRQMFGEKMPKLEAGQPFVPNFSITLAEPVGHQQDMVTITNLPITVEQINLGPAPACPVALPSPLSPASGLGNLTIRSPLPSPGPVYSTSPASASAYTSNPGLSMAYGSSPSMAYGSSPNMVQHSQWSSPSTGHGSSPRKAQPPVQPEPPGLELPVVDDQKMEDFIQSLLAPSSSTFDGIHFDGYRNPGTVCTDGETDKREVRVVKKEEAEKDNTAGSVDAAATEVGETGKESSKDDIKESRSEQGKEVSEALEGLKLI